LLISLAKKRKAVKDFFLTAFGKLLNQIH